MLTECDFSMEHADGTFIEHLLFCHDYADAHYPEHSPNSLVTQSWEPPQIRSQWQQTKFLGEKELITAEEFRQVQAFLYPKVADLRQLLMHLSKIYKS